MLTGKWQIFRYFQKNIVRCSKIISEEKRIEIFLKNNFIIITYIIVV